ncbi:MAG: FAD-dependent monooxygenase, partial [Nitrospirota bacterium]|nr:FAD-dependent monooxygenase [Nitrospirota bacterium]
MTRKAEIVVVGGGPAGCIVALGLARLGHQVRLITAPRRRSATEGFSERVVRALEANECRHALGALGPVVPREASWNGEKSAANQEWVVAREHFDAALLEDASAAGTTIEHVRVRRLHRLPQGWRIETGGDTFAADYLIEARGRQAPGRRRRGPATTSLGQTWRGLPKGGRTAVTGFRRGWAWFATTGDGCGSLQIMLASDPAVLPKRSGLAAFYATLLAEIDARAWLADAQPDGAVHARHAETSAAVTPLGDGHVRVGDAVLAIDPLAGHGVFEAIA